MIKKILLNNDVSIPTIGLGTYKIGHTDDETYHAVRMAIDNGYRHIDTAALYLNEEAVGKAIRDSGISRDNIFVTTKLWGTDILSDRISEAFNNSLKKLKLDYIDLYLVHWPVKGKLTSTWHEMENIYLRGRTRAIGLSNHLIHHVEEVLQRANITPAVNQMELHPHLVQQEVVDYCKSKGIVAEAWSPLGSSKIPLLQEDLLTKLGNKYDKSPAQIVLRWNIQKGIVVIPKSSNKDRQIDNINIYNFELTTEEIQQIDTLNKDHRTGAHPDYIEF